MQAKEPKFDKERYSFGILLGNEIVEWPEINQNWAIPL